MTIISTFEIVLKPQSPAPPTTPGAPDVDTVLQGYFLQVSNPNDKAYFVQPRFIAPVDQQQGAKIPNGVIAFVDAPSGNALRTLKLSSTPDHYVLVGALVEVPARGSVLVALLPAAFGVPRGFPAPLPNANLEVRGYVDLLLPPIFEEVRSGKFSFGRFVAQDKNPVELLVTAQNRGTYFGESNAETKGQSQATVANGTVSLAPESPFLITVPQIGLDRIEGFVRTLNAAGGDAELDALRVRGMLAALEEDPKALKSFNRSLEESGAKLRLSVGK